MRIGYRFQQIPVLAVTLAVAVFGFVAVSPVVVPQVWAAGAKPKLTTATDSRIVFEIEIDDYRLEPSKQVEGAEVLIIPGLGGFSEPGMPQIPGRIYLVAIPAGAAYTVRSTVVGSQPLGRVLLEPVPFPLVLEDENGETYVSEEYRLDAAVYNTGGTRIDVTAEPDTRIRHQRVLPIRVVPVSFDPQTREAVLATRIRVEVTLRGAGGGGDLFSDTGGAPVVEAPVWERIYKKVLVNPEQGVSWRSKPQRPKRLDLKRSSRADVTGPALKIGVHRTGLHRVSAAALVGAGLPAGTPVADLHLFKRVYDTDALTGTIVDIPFRVVEDPSGTGEVFDADDWLVFYGLRLMDDAFQNDPREKFADANIYWLSTSGGSQMTTRDVPPGVVSADTSAATFPVETYYEEDNWFFEGTPPGHKEFFFYDAEWKQPLTIPLSVGAVDPSGTFRLEAGFQGAVRDRTDRSVKLSIISSTTTTPLEPALVPGKTYVTYQSPVMPGTVITPGTNTLRVDKTSDRSYLEALLDWVRIEYRSHYRALGNVIEFNSGTLSGDTSVTVTGLSRTDVMLFDVTDPLLAQEIPLTGGQLTPVGGGYAVSIRESLAERRSYVLTPLDRISEIPSGDLRLDTPSSIIGSAAENGVDLLVVCHGDFTSQLDDLVRYRRAQGYSVLMADVEDIYDEFNGGVPHAHAIKRFMRHFFETGGASFVLLVGDASEDNKRVDSKSGINFVPTESFTEYVGGTFNKDEVVTTDKWYVMFDCDFINDDTQCIDFPDIILGRLPVGSAVEARDVVDKILAFEQPSGEDFWRRRVIRVADNPFSGAGYLCYVSSEEDFQRAEETAAQMFEDAIPQGFDVIKMFMSEMIDEPPHTAGSCELASVLTTRTRSNMTPKLIGELNQGATFVSIQAHMNRYLVGHEWLLTTSQGSPDGILDYTRMNNTGRPWILFAMGCHFVDYALHRELSETTLNGPNGDSFGELLLFCRNTGAVATYASAGYEYLYPNKNFTQLLVGANFENVPTDTMVASDRAQARWILGELMTVAEIENLTRYKYVGSGDGARGQMKRYHLLGDPLLRIDGGPPRFDVTVNDEEFHSGDEVIVRGSQKIHVRAIVTDEVAIEQLRLEIDGADSTSLLNVNPLKDDSLSASRQYEVTFEHTLQARNYDVVLRAYQAADTTGTNYNIVAEFVLKVQVNAALTVNGRPTLSGDLVPADGEYVFELGLPVYVDPSLFRVETNGEPVIPIHVTNPDPQDSTIWDIAFTQTLPTGKHTVTLFVDDAEFPFEVVVGEHAGLLDLIPYPNPFVDEVYFVFTNEIKITSGTIDIFTTSGKKVAHLTIPPGARTPGQNAVRWDGRAFGGSDVANGVYLFVASVDQGGQGTTQRGKLVRTR